MASALTGRVATGAVTATVGWVPDPEPPAAAAAAAEVPASAVGVVVSFAWESQCKKVETGPFSRARFHSEQTCSLPDLMLLQATTGYYMCRVTH